MTAAGYDGKYCWNCGVRMLERELSGAGRWVRCAEITRVCIAIDEMPDHGLIMCVCHRNLSLLSIGVISSVIDCSSIVHPLTLKTNLILGYNPCLFSFIFLHLCPIGEVCLYFLSQIQKRKFKEIPPK